MYQILPTLFKQWFISLEIMPTGIVEDASNILRVGIGGNKEKHGDRTPLIQVPKHKTSIRIITAIGENHNYKFPDTDPIPLNNWTRIEISQLRHPDDVYQFTIRIAGTIYMQLVNTDPREYSDLKVYTSDNHYPAANAKIANLTIKTFPDKMFAVTRNHLYQTLPTLFKQWSVIVYIMPNGIEKDHSNILLIGTGANNEEYGARTPAINVASGTTKLIVSSAINGNNNYHLGITNPILMHEWTRVEVSQLLLLNGSYQYTIRIGDTIFAQMENTDPREFLNVKVYASNNYRSAANAMIANLTIDTFPTFPTFPTFQTFATLPTTTTSTTATENIIPNTIPTTPNGKQ